MSEEFIIKRKLIFDGDGTGEEKKILAFVKLIPKYILGDDPSGSQATYNKLVAQLESIVTGRRKLDLIESSNTTQTNMFKELQTTYQDRTMAIKDDIIKQKELLRRAKLVKQNNVEYELLRKILNKEPSRKEMGKRIEGMKKEIKNLEREKKNLNRKFDLRVKQCFVLSTSANTLKGILDEDNAVGDNQMDVSSINSEGSELDMKVTLG